MSKKFLITGGAGFIGSAVVRELTHNTQHQVVNIDKLTYAGNLESLTDIVDSPRYTFIHADITDATAMQDAFAKYQPDIVMYLAAQQGTIGDTYNIGGHNEKKNIEVVKLICELLDELCPVGADLFAINPGSALQYNRAQVRSYKALITHVTDRPGHDLRYAIDAGKIEREMGWKPQESFESGLRKTVQWYLDNKDWWQRVQNGSYQGKRLGASA